MTVLTIPVPPCGWLSTNQRQHHFTRAADTKVWRTLAMVTARAARHEPVPAPFVVTAVVHRRNQRLYDLDGITPTIKACLDGCRDAGLIADDDYRHMPQLTIVAGDVDPEHPRLTLHLTHSPATVTVGGVAYTGEEGL